MTGDHFRFTFFFFNDTATTEIYTLSLHDALPICLGCMNLSHAYGHPPSPEQGKADRKSTRLNSSHQIISYAVFCLKKKKKTKTQPTPTGPPPTHTTHHPPQPHPHTPSHLNTYTPY